VVGVLYGKYYYYGLRGVYMICTGLKIYGWSV